MKKIFRKVLATAMMFGLIAGSVSTFSPVTSSEAASKPTVASKATVVKGTTKTIPINGNGFLMLRILPKSSNKSVATVKNVNNNLEVKGKKKGTAVITTTIKAKKHNKTKTYKLKTKITVKVGKVEKLVVNSFADLKKSLEAMQKDGGTVVVNTSEGGDINIAKASYSKVYFIINAPNATITNNAIYKSVTVQSIKETWYEKASGNNYVFETTRPIRLNIDLDATVNDVRFNGTVTSAVQTVEAFGTLKNAHIENIAPVEIKATAETSRIGYVDIGVFGATVSIETNIGSSISKISVLKTSTLNLTGNSTSLINVEKVSTAIVNVADTLTAVSITEIK